MLSVAVHSAAVTAAVAGAGEVGGEDYADPIAAGGFAVCRVGCPDAFWNCNDWCLKNGHKNGGVCVPPQRQQCCCYGPQEDSCIAV